MTKDEFNNTLFKATRECYYLNDSLKLNNDKYIIKGVDRALDTLWLSKGSGDEGFWALYQNVELIK